ncbi:MAG: M14 family zinc carboxypeptidase [Acidobacteriota bacterium]
MRTRFMLAAAVVIALVSAPPAGAPLSALGGAILQTPEAFLGFTVGADRKLARWDRILEYLRNVDAASDRVDMRELGKTTQGNPFVALEISSPANLARRAHYKALQRRLYFQDGEPTPAERDEIFRDGKAVVAITCNIHSTEIGASQMVLEFVHRLATEDTPRMRHVLDNVILVLVPSLNPDGQIMVVDWYNKNVGTPFETSSMPWLYHPYVGHDNNRDMYMFTQVESQLTARLLWHDWFPAVWLDEHQMGGNGARIFVMPATDPINPNVHPLIYRWNGIFGQAQAAALEAAGKDGVIYNATYTNFWQGAMAWSGWWHNQVGMLTEVASVRVATPTEQQRADPNRQATAGGADVQAQMRRPAQSPDQPLPPPRDITPRTEYPRPWLGGRWTLRDIVDYELIVSQALIEAAADRRETLLRHLYEVNRLTVEAGTKGDPAAILIRADAQHDPQVAYRLVDRLQIGGVQVHRAEAPFHADGTEFPAGTFVIPMAQPYARYAKDLLEKQTYPEVRRTPTSPPEPPYDVTAWSLGMLMGADVTFVRRPLDASARLTKLDGAPKPAGTVTGSGRRFAFDYRGTHAAMAVNRLLKAGAQLSLVQGDASAGRAARVEVDGVARAAVEGIASALGLQVQATDARAGSGRRALKSPRLGLYQPWSSNMDEGWTRWVLEQHEFPYTTLHNDDVKAGGLRERFDVILFADQRPADIVGGASGSSVRPEYRGGIGDQGVKALAAFVAKGGTIVTMGNACDFAIERFSVPLRNLKAGLTRDEHFAPGTILNIEIDTSSPIGAGMPSATKGFYVNSPFFGLTEAFSSQKVSVVARYPNAGLVASGWLKGEALMAGRAAVVAVELNPGRVVLFGLRPQHRAQTQATFPLLFNALYWAAR